MYLKSPHISPPARRSDPKRDNDRDLVRAYTPLSAHSAQDPGQWILREVDLFRYGGKLVPRQYYYETISTDLWTNARGGRVFEICPSTQPEGPAAARFAIHVFPSSGGNTQSPEQYRPGADTKKDKGDFFYSLAESSTDAMQRNAREKALLEDNPQYPLLKKREVEACNDINQQKSKTKQDKANWNAELSEIALEKQLARENLADDKNVLKKRIRSLSQQARKIKQKKWAAPIKNQDDLKLLQQQYDAIQEQIRQLEAPFRQTEYDEKQTWALRKLAQSEATHLQYELSWTTNPKHLSSTKPLQEDDLASWEKVPWTVTITDRQNGADALLTELHQRLSAITGPDQAANTIAQVRAADILNGLIRGK